MKKLYRLICVLLNLIFNFLSLLTLVIIFNWLLLLDQFYCESNDQIV